MIILVSWKSAMLSEWHGFNINIALLPVMMELFMEMDHEVLHTPVETMLAGDHTAIKAKRERTKY